MRKIQSSLKKIKTLKILKDSQLIKTDKND